jgi:formylglycine-generating enzyme required for sulfatase activity
LVLVGGLAAALGIALWSAEPSREELIEQVLAEAGPEPTAAIAPLAVGLVGQAAFTDQKVPPGMVWVPPGDYMMGVEDERFPDASPRHRVTVDGFWMDRTEVTNAQYARFVKATGYKTIAERQPDPRDYPGAKPENLVPGSAVFRSPPGKSENECLTCLADGRCDLWWVYTPGACWLHPEGPDSKLKGRANHPVVHIAWVDAVAYCEWAGKRLPTEAEWEWAARGGIEGKPYYWGSELKPEGQWMANIWQGPFPARNTGEDGYLTTAPVGSFPPNGYGLCDMVGNAWEWCSDWYDPTYYKKSPVKNPKGPERSLDPSGHGEALRVMRGGSFLCSDNYCIRYMAGARHHGAPDTGLQHNGFRCVWQPSPGKEK